ncbi:TPA: hypothetical protein GXX44_00785 [bacterium]|nr:hypothetical protein [bacterium]
MKRRTTIKLLLFVTLLFFATGQLGGCLSCVTGTGSISGTVKNAVTGDALSGATVKAGGIQTTTGSNGTYKLENVPAGTQTVTASKTGYITDSKQVLVVGDQETTNVNFALSPPTAAGQIRIVLTWGENPEDLDSHLLVPTSDNNGDLGYEVYFGEEGSDTAYPFAKLDTDDTTSYGPETVTIYQRYTQKYKYFVHHWYGTGDLAHSGAVVKVYSGASLIKTYNVPTTQTANHFYWYVFDINSDGSITDRNVIQASAPTL